jgi:hypothetical protein
MVMVDPYPHNKGGVQPRALWQAELAIVHAGVGDAQTVIAAMRIPFELKERKHLTGVPPSPELLSVVGCRGERPSQHTVTLVHAGAHSQGIIAVRFTSSLR